MTNLKVSAALKKRAACIQVLLMDVDGTMTSGGVTLLSQTDEVALEIKTFDAHDGQDLTLAQTAGLRSGCIIGRHSSALLRRAREMNMEFIYMKQPLKMPAYEEILQKTGVPDSAVAYVGDDHPDLPIMRRVGLAVAVGDAVPEIEADDIRFRLIVAADDSQLLDVKPATLQFLDGIFRCRVLAESSAFVLRRKDESWKNPSLRSAGRDYVIFVRTTPSTH